MCVKNAKERKRKTSHFSTVTCVLRLQKNRTISLCYLFDLELFESVVLRENSFEIKLKEKNGLRLFFLSCFPFFKYSIGDRTRKNHI